MMPPSPRSPCISLLSSSHEEFVRTVEAGGEHSFDHHRRRLRRRSRLRVGVVRGLVCCLSPQLELPLHRDHRVGGLRSKLGRLRRSLSLCRRRRVHGVVRQRVVAQLGVGSLDHGSVGSLAHTGAQRPETVRRQIRIVRSSRRIQNVRSSRRSPANGSYPACNLSLIYC